MAVSDSYLTFVLEQLSGVLRVVTKRMFGGVGIYSGETFFAVIDNDTLFFKVDETLAAKYRKLGMPPFAPIPGQKPMIGYYQVPPDVLEDGDELAKWAGDSVGVGNAGKSKGPRVQRSKGAAPKGPTVHGSVTAHFTDRSKPVRTTYDAILTAARKLGPVREEPKKTSIHLVRTTAFAGIATRRASLILTLKSATDIASPRIRKHEQASANRWHLEVELAAPKDVDRDIRKWLARSYDLAGPKS